MNSYEAKYAEKFLSDGQLVTAVKKLGQLIDSSWCHSWHWKLDEDGWLDRIKHSLATEMDHARERMKDLQGAEKIVDSIDLDEEEAKNV